MEKEIVKYVDAWWDKDIDSDEQKPTNVRERIDKYFEFVKDEYLSTAETYLRG